MAVKIIALKCPQCGADLEIAQGKEVIYCTYCGTKIIVDNENEHVYRHIDDADIERAKTERMVQIRQLSIDEQNKQQKTKLVLYWAISCAILIVIGIIGFSIDNAGMGMCIMFALLDFAFGMLYLTEKNDKDKEEANIRAGRIKIKHNSSELKGKDYNYVENMMKSAGFTNISLQPMGDLTFGIIKKSGQVDNISINGDDNFGSDSWFYPDSSIIISYHSKAAE